MTSLPVPFHFTATFLVAVAAAAGLWVAISRRQFAPPGTWARRAFAAGWALLGLGEILHGSLIASSELDQSAVALRSGAYAFFVLSLLGTKKPRPAAGAVAGANAGSALMPSFLGVSAAWFAARSSLPGARRLAASLALFGASELLFGAGGADAAARPGAVWYLAHGARLAAGVAVAAWLWRVFRTSIQVRFVAVFVSVLLVVIVAISSTMTQVFAGNVREEALRRATLQGELQERTVREREQESINRARNVAEQDSVRAAVAGRSPQLADLAQRLQGPGGIFDTSDFMAFFDPNGAILAVSATDRGGQPTLDSAEVVSLAGTAVVQSGLQQIQAASVDAIGQTKIGIIAAYPVIAPRGTETPGSPPVLAGAVALGEVMDREYLSGLPGIEEGSQDQGASLITRNAVLTTTLGSPLGLLGQRRREMERAVFDRVRTYNAEGPVGGIDYFNSYVPLERRDNEVIAALVISQRSEVLELTQRDVGRRLFLLALIAASIAIGLSYVSGSRITRPIRDLTRAAERIRQGDLEVQVEPAGDDEVGALSGAFGEMTVSLARLTGELRDAAEQEFRLRSRLETILQSMDDGVVAVGAEGEVITLNREAERILGIGSERAAGRRIDQVLKVEQADGGRLDLPIYALKRGSARGVVTSARRNGRDTPVAITSAPIEDEAGSVIGAVGVVRDLTREIEVEKMKTEFLSNISHELRTPLTPIKGYTDLLRRKQVPRAKAVVFLDSIGESVRRLERIVDMLVDFAAMEAGRLVPRKVPVDLDKATAALIEAWHRAAPGRRFERRGFARLPMMNVDQRLIPRALDELIDNAVKFDPEGGKITVAVESDRADGAGTVQISVVDRGIGIPADQLPSIFSDFVQVDASETRRFGGLGLGLAYVRRIVEAHDGRLEVESTPGRGSRFTIVLPASAALRRGRPSARKTAAARNPRAGSRSRGGAGRPMNKKKRGR